LGVLPLINDATPGDSPLHISAALFNGVRGRGILRRWYPRSWICRSTRVGLCGLALVAWIWVNPTSCDPGWV